MIPKMTAMIILEVTKFEVTFAPVHATEAYVEGRYNPSVL
jgi:hypothetical protein